MVNFLRFAVAGNVSPRTLAILLEKLNDEEKLSNLSASSLCSVVIAVTDCVKVLGSRSDAERFVRVVTSVLLKKDFGEARTFPLLKMAEKVAKTRDGMNVVYNTKLFDRLCEFAVTQKMDFDKICWLAHSLRNAVSSPSKPVPSSFL